MNKIFKKALCVTFLFGIGVPVHAAKLIDPPRSEWGCELTNERVLQGITAGLIGRGWVLSSNDKNGNLVAQVIVRGKHTLVVDISYTTSAYDINYKSSDNLKYKLKNEVPYIHRNANSWMDNIQLDITAQLQALCKLQ
jgi:hypothetical protein